MRTQDFYAFIVERETIRLKKEAGEPWPWTEDPILQKYKFTNVRREHDRTTRWMRENWTGPNKDKELHLQLFNCALFRYFGTIEFAEAIGWQSHWTEFEQNTVKSKAAYRLAHRDKVFTGAYVITNQGISAPKQEVVVDMFLTPFFEACPSLITTAQKTKSWQAVATEMRKLQGFGGTGFMTKEVLQDAVHTPAMDYVEDLNTWCPIGPGARRGLNRVMERDLRAKASESQMLWELMLLYNHRSLNWPRHLGELELHDIQFQLCEFDKMERVKHGQGRPRSLYRRPE